MEALRPTDLVTVLRSPINRVRIGLWLYPTAVIGQESIEAARLQIEAVDIRQPLIASLPEGTRFLVLNVDRLIELLDEICQGPKGMDCLLIYHLDLLLARLTQDACRHFWDQMFIGFPNRKRALIFGMPKTATILLPNGNRLEGWKREQRLAIGIS